MKNLQNNLIISPVPKLSSGSLKTLLLVTLWMTFVYGAGMYMQEANGGYEPLVILTLVLGFAPVALWSVYDYRLGLLFAIVATPFFDAPVIPHGFTQGFGDFFAVCAVVGYLWRHPDPLEWRYLWRKEYVWLLLILIAAFISLATSPVLGVEGKYGIKYGLAEIAGFMLAMAFMIILAYEMRDRDDIKVFLIAVALAVLVVALYSLASLFASLNCIDGLGARSSLTTNGAITSTFKNPNYHAAYLLTVLPLVLWYYLHLNQRNWIRYLVAAIIFAVIFFVQYSLSRSGFFGLIVIWLGWLAITRWKRGTRTITVIFCLMLPLTIPLWWIPTYSCIVLEEQNSLLNSAGDKIVNAKHRSKHVGDGGIRVRIELAKNAGKLFQVFPLTGVGVGLMANYSAVDGVRNRAHNVMLTVLAEQGIFGFLAWAGWVLSLFLLLMRKLRLNVERSQQSLFAMLGFASILVLSMTMDFYRVIWIWQLGALILALGVVRFESTPVDSLSR